VTLGDVAQADDEQIAAAVAGAAHRYLGREQRAIFAARGDLGSDAQTAEGVARAREPGETLDHRSVHRDSGQQHVQPQA
jgi:hypothetical protein